MRYEQVIFKNQDVILDGQEFDRCTFTFCNIIYRGGKLPSLTNVRFDTCKFTLDGEAGNTLIFLRALYRMESFRPIIEATFENIRGNVAPQGEHDYGFDMG